MCHSIVIICKADMATRENSDVDKIESIDRRAKKPHGELGP
jgi:hypothetical protein